MLNHDRHIKSLLAKNIELTKYLIVAIKRLGGEQFFDQAELDQLASLQLQKKMLNVHTVRIAVVELDEQD